MICYGHCIGGAVTDPAAGEWFDTYNPYTGEPWARIARGTAADAEAAVAAARAAFEGWATTKPTARGKLLVRLAELIERDAARLAEIEVRDNGKLYAEMSAQTRYMAEWYRYYGGLADKLEGAVLPQTKRNLQLHPLRAARCLGHDHAMELTTPAVAWKLAPALAAGNVAVVKPSEFTSASTLEFMALVEEAGLPTGCCQYGDRIRRRDRRRACRAPRRGWHRVHRLGRCRPKNL